ncbi:MAG: hypothetical protein HGB10_01330 [Coriobacteriia bacterium]|nr:hypothetical protein [Coriobacteriia bacterium]
MTPAEVKSTASADLVDMLTHLRPSGDAVAWLAAVISDPAAVEGVAELRRRYAPEPSFPVTGSGRMSGATTVFIDRGRWNAFFFQRRIPLMHVGALMEPELSEGWASVVGHKGRAGFASMDSLACALDMHVDDLIWQVGTDAERERLAACV